MFKQIAMDAYYASKPPDIFIGMVTSEKPLKIKIKKNIILTEQFLIIPINLKEHTVTATVNGTKQKIIFSNQLKKKTNVLLVRQSGGQKYAILGVI